MGRIGELEVHNTARFTAAQDNVDYGAQLVVSVLLAGVFDELHTQYVFGSDGRYLLVCHFNAVDTGLYGPPPLTLMLLLRLSTCRRAMPRLFSRS